MNGRTWLHAALIRAIKTMAQTATAMLSTAVVLADIDVQYVISATILAGILSILTSLGGLPEVDMVADAVDEETEENTDENN